MEGQHLSRAQAQVAGLLIGRIRILFAAVPQLKEQAIPTCHQTIYDLVIYHLRIYTFSHFLIFAFGHLLGGGGRILIGIK